MFFLLVLIVLVHQCSAVIYSLNESEYLLMPPLFELDDYDSCLLQPGGTYCVIDVDLFTEEPSDLMHMIQEYSEHTVKHFNHTQIHRGVCVTSTCSSFIQNRSVETIEDLSVILGGCLNDSLWRSYEIQGKVGKIEYCKREGERTIIDTSDIIVAVVYLVLIVLNVVGSLYDIFSCKNDDKSGNPYLLAFSLRRNCAKLVASSGGSEPRLDRLKLFHALRTMTMVCVFFSHTVIIMAFSYVKNPLYIEKSYEDPLKQILFNGSLVTHTFFVMSSFLLAYNFQLYAEKHQVTWLQFPKGVFLRWLRLTPTYALVLATVSTWMRHIGSGPLWEYVVVSESNACRNYWWAHVLYINNYLYDDAYCALQTWYLAADTQLFCVGLMICIMARTPRAQQVALTLMFVAALVTPAAHTYFQDLDAVVIQTPESIRSLYAHNKTFRLLYARGHTNLSTYTLGMAGGLLAYYLQREGKDLTKYKYYNWLIWLTFPLGVAVILSGGLFYSDGDPASTPLRVLYATLYKPVFQTLVVTLIIGCIFKVESVYRGILEWRAFTWTGRVSYSAFLLHTLFQRGLIGAEVVLINMSDYYVIVVLCATIFLSFLCASALWVCVEAPLGALTKAALAPRARRGPVETSKI